MNPEEAVYVRNQVYKTLTKSISSNKEPDGNTTTSSGERTERRNLYNIITRHNNASVDVDKNNRRI